jgi:hypothetical protein
MRASIPKARHGGAYSFLQSVQRYGQLAILEEGKDGLVNASALVDAEVPVKTGVGASRRLKEGANALCR